MLARVCADGTLRQEKEADKITFTLRLSDATHVLPIQPSLPWIRLCYNMLQELHVGCLLFLSSLSMCPELTTLHHKNQTSFNGSVLKLSGQQTTQNHAPNKCTLFNSALFIQRTPEPHLQTSNSGEKEPLPYSRKKP